MKLTGQILTVMILVMSLVFMSLSLAVYATHRNWKDAVERDQPGPNGALGLKKQLESERKESNNLRVQIADLMKKIAAEDLDKRQRLANLETHRAELESELADQRERLTTVDAQRKEAIAAVESSQKSLNNLVGEVNKLRGEIRDTIDDRDKQYAKAVDLLDRIHSVSGELTRTKERENQLTRQLGQLRKSAEGMGVSLDAPATPPKLNGQVLAVNKEKMLEVSFGSDDGIRVGSKLQIYRGDQYLAEVDVISVDTDRAVAKISGRQYGPVKKGDNVTTRFKDGIAARDTNR